MAVMYYCFKAGGRGAAYLLCDLLVRHFLLSQPCSDGSSDYWGFRSTPVWINITFTAFDENGPK